MTRPALQIACGILCLAWGAAGQTQTPSEAELRPGQVVRRAIAGGEVHRFRVSMEAGQVLKVLTRPQGVDLKQALKSPDDKSLAESRAIHPLAAEDPLFWVAEAPASYVLEVRAARRSAKKGRYDVRVTLGPAQAEDRKRVAVQTAILVEMKALGMKGRWQEQVKASQTALALAREVGWPWAEARLLGLLGAAHLSLGDARAALEPFQQAHALYRKLSVQADGQGLFNLGQAYLELGGYQDALDYLQRARSRYRAVSLTEGEAMALGRLGDLYSTLGEYGTASRLHREAGAISTREGDRFNELKALSSGADAAAVAGDAATALARYQKLLALLSGVGHGAGQAEVLLAMGALHLQLKEPQRALDPLTRSLELVRAGGDQRDEPLALWMLGDARRALGQAEQAGRHYEEAASLARARENPMVLAWALAGRAHLERDRGRLAEARRLMAEATEALEAARPALRSEELRLPYAALTREAYDLSVDVLMQLHAGDDPAQGLDRTALEVSERGRARALLQTLQDARIDTGPAPPTALSAAQIQALLDPETMLVEYHLGADRSYAWVATPDTLVSVPLPRESEVAEQARRFHQLVTERNRRGSASRAAARLQQLRQADTALAEVARQLSETVLGPLPAPRGKRLMIVADGALHYVPFAALPLPRSWSAGEGALVTRYEIGNLPSASVVAFQRGETASRKPPTREVAVFADPVFDRRDGRIRGRRAPAGEGRARGASSMKMTLSGGPLPRLEYTRLLADRVAGTLPPAAVLKATDFDANREAALSPQLADFRTVVFATHGLLDTRHPERSSIALSMVNERGQPQDGYLRLRDVYRLQLNADLVVLGACETGLGREIRGEGLIGLSRGFMHAGATRVLASLWKVEEEATVTLLEEFLRLVQKEGRSHPAALREAQLRVARDPRWRSPYYWAGFVLQGDWRPAARAERP